MDLRSRWNDRSAPGLAAYRNELAYRPNTIGMSSALVLDVQTTSLMATRSRPTETPMFTSSASDGKREAGALGLLGNRLKMCFLAWSRVSVMQNSLPPGCSNDARDESRPCGCAAK